MRTINDCRPNFDPPEKPKPRIAYTPPQDSEDRSYAALLAKYLKPGDEQETRLCVSQPTALQVFNPSERGAPTSLQILGDEVCPEVAATAAQRKEEMLKTTECVHQFHSWCTKPDRHEAGNCPCAGRVCSKCRSEVAVLFECPPCGLVVCDPCRASVFAAEDDAAEASYEAERAVAELQHKQVWAELARSDARSWRICVCTSRRGAWITSASGCRRPRTSSRQRGWLESFSTTAR